MSNRLPFSDQEHLNKHFHFAFWIQKLVENATCGVRLWGHLYRSDAFSVLWRAMTHSEERSSGRITRFADWATTRAGRQIFGESLRQLIRRFPVTRGGLRLVCSGCDAKLNNTHFKASVRCAFESYQLVLRRVLQSQQTLASVPAVDEGSDPGRAPREYTARWQYASGRSWILGRQFQLWNPDVKYRGITGYIFIPRALNRSTAAASNAPK
jgi:hypothetical protein